MFNKTYKTLFHKDENDNIRVWWMEQEDNKYRTVSGVENGNLVTSEWKEVFGKNTGKKNATTDEEQATAEIQALYKKKLERKYYENRKDIDQGSKIIEPMLAEKYKGWASLKGQKVFVQPKLDGMRCLASKEGLFSREGKRIVSCLHIEQDLFHFFQENPDVVLDGELYNHHLKDDFNELISIARKTKPDEKDLFKSKHMIKYYVYDMIGYNSFNLRYQFLKENLIYLPSIEIVDTAEISTQEELDGNYAILLSEGYEGQMIRLNAPYEHKRSKNLLKRKEFIDEEFPVDEIIEGEGNWAGYAKSVRFHTKNGVVCNAGIKGNQDFCRELLTRNPVPKTVTVRYQNVTPDGSLRFPIACCILRK